MWWAISLVVVGVGALLVGMGIGMALGYTESQRAAVREAARWPRRQVHVDGSVTEHRVPWEEPVVVRPARGGTGEAASRCRIPTCACDGRIDHATFMATGEFRMGEAGEFSPSSPLQRPSEEAAAPGFTGGAEPPPATDVRPLRGEEGAVQRKKRSTEAIIRAHEEAGR